MVSAQTGVEAEVIIVDSGSTDKTLEIAQTFPIARIVNIDSYTPGTALNAGIEASRHEHIAFISAHCVPVRTDWLHTLLAAFEMDSHVAGVYGKQLPMAFSDPIDRNDLIMAFGEEARIQRKDWFFHNANSCIKRSVWNEFSFDPHASNIEDRIWAKQVTEAGFSIVYEPEAQVFHHNGLHRTSDSNRLRRHVEIIESISEQVLVPSTTSLLPENAVVVSLVPVSDENLAAPYFSDFLSRLVSELDSSKLVEQTVVISPDGKVGDDRVLRLTRSQAEISADSSLDAILQSTVLEYEQNFAIPDFYLYCNWDYEQRPDGLFDKLVFEARRGGYDTVFGAEKDFSHYWIADNESGEFRQIDPSLTRREDRSPAYRALYGLGTLVSAPILRSGRLTGGRVGILELEGNYFRRRKGN